MPTLLPRATDWDVVLDAARASLIANATISTALDIAHNPKRIAPREVEQGVTLPYIVLQFTPTYRSSYGHPAVSGPLDVSCYTQGWSTTTVRALLKACIKALFDDAWVTTAMDAEGVQLLSASLEEQGAGIRDIDEVIDGSMVRGKQVTGRIWCQKVA